MLRLANSTQSGGGLGLFACVDVKPFTFICFYTGIKKHSASIEQLPFEIIKKKLGYLYTLPCSNSLILDPTCDHSGNLLPEYIPTRTGTPEELNAFGGLYLNEPGLDLYPNCAFAYDVSSDRVEIWSIRDIHKGEELFLFYGEGMYRTYLLSQHLFQISNLSLMFYEYYFTIELDGMSIRSCPRGKLVSDFISSFAQRDCVPLIEPLLNYLFKSGHERWIMAN